MENTSRRIRGHRTFYSDSRSLNAVSVDDIMPLSSGCFCLRIVGELTNVYDLFSCDELYWPLSRYSPGVSIYIVQA